MSVFSTTAFVAPLAAIPISATPLTTGLLSPPPPQHSNAPTIRHLRLTPAVTHAERSPSVCIAHPLVHSQPHALPYSKHHPPSHVHPAGRLPARWHCKVPAHPGRAPWEPSESSESPGLTWKDRVALYAQFSPSATLFMLLDALRARSRDDAGIEALYAFANIDVWQVAHRFFGRNMDLGQFERFKRVIVAPPYDALLHHDDREILGALTLTTGQYMARVRFTMPHRDPIVLTFRLTRGTLGAHTSWLVDSILHETPGGDGRPPARDNPRPRSAS